MLEVISNNPNADCIRTITDSPVTPYKMWKFDGTQLSMLMNTNIKEPYNKPRQQLPETFIQTANIDIIRTKTILDKKSISGDIILGYKEDGFYDIDHDEDFIQVCKIMEDSNE